MPLQNGQTQKTTRVPLKAPRQPNHRLRELRRNKGWSRATLSYESGGIAPKTIRDIEEGFVRNPHVNTMFALATALGVKVSDLDRDQVGDRV